MNNNKDKIKDLIIKTVLIIIIIILLIHNCNIIKKTKEEKRPTGNVGIIEIKCDKGDKCQTDDDNKDKDNEK